MHVCHRSESFMGISLCGNQACQNAACSQKRAVEEFNALSKVLTNNVFNFRALEPPLHTCPALLNLANPSGPSPLSSHIVRRMPSAPCYYRRL